jgi:hypothetical protein
MERDGVATFRLPIWFQIGLFALAMSDPCVYLLTDLHFGMPLSALSQLIMIAALVLAWIFLMPYYTVQIRPDGIKLYSLWWLPWTAVNDVRYWKLFGLPHFSVKRRGGLFSWHIPLYFVGDSDLQESIIRAAPPGNPFKMVSIPS